MIVFVCQKRGEKWGENFEFMKGSKDRGGWTEEV